MTLKLINRVKFKQDQPGRITRPRATLMKGHDSSHLQAAAPGERDDLHIARPIVFCKPQGNHSRQAPTKPPSPRPRFQSPRAPWTTVSWPSSAESGRRIGSMRRAAWSRTPMAIPCADGARVRPVLELVLEVAFVRGKWAIGRIGRVEAGGDCKAAQRRAESAVTAAKGSRERRCRGRCNRIGERRKWWNWREQWRFTIQEWNCHHTERHVGYGREGLSDLQFIKLYYI